MKIRLGKPSLFYYITDDKKIKFMKQENYISLYDYLGKAAGGELGKKVYKYAQFKNVKPKIRTIENTKYKGEVMLYPKWLLQEYFQVMRYPKCILQEYFQIEYIFTNEK
jgi:hypothetical protein